MKKISLLFFAVLLVLSACFNGSTDSHTHSYDWVVYATGTNPLTGEDIGTCTCGSTVKRPTTATPGLTYSYETTFYRGYGVTRGYIGISGVVVIPHYYRPNESSKYVPVTLIELSGFAGCTNLTSITIPSTVMGIESFGFFGCTSLTSITIPSSFIGIAPKAFQDCTNLTSVIIHADLKYITDGLFEDCTNLSDITIPPSVINITLYSFKNCTNLVNLTIPPSVTTITEPFYGWTPAQTIRVPFPNGIIGADAAWGIGWRNNCSANIVGYTP